MENLALKTAFSASVNASADAAHRLLMVQPIAARLEVQSAIYYGRLNNSTNGAKPAVRMWHGRLDAQDPRSLVYQTVKQNRHWTSITNTRTIATRLTRLPEPVVVEPLTKPWKSATALADIQALSRNKSNVAGVLELLPNGKLRHALQPGAIKNRKHRVNVLRWLMGGVCTHMLCRHCNQELSRQHGLDCSGATAYLTRKYYSLLDPNSALNVMDELLNKCKDKQCSKSFYYTISKAIAMIYVQCLGFRQQKNGFWVDPESCVPDPSLDSDDSEKDEDSSDDDDEQFQNRATTSNQRNTVATRRAVTRQTGLGSAGNESESTVDSDTDKEQATAARQEQATAARQEHATAAQTNPAAAGSRTHVRSITQISRTVRQRRTRNPGNRRPTVSVVDNMAVSQVNSTRAPTSSNQPQRQQTEASSSRKRSRAASTQATPGQTTLDPRSGRVVRPRQSKDPG
jgi:hypothetical protein